MKQLKISKSNENRRTMKSRRLLVPILLACLVSAGTIGGTMAWITARTGAVTNTFTPSYVTSEIVETVNKYEKSNVFIKNTGDIDAYVRAALVFSWVDANGNIADIVPVEIDDYEITFSEGNSWFEGSDGFWYCTSKVRPEDNSPVLISKCVLTEEGKNKKDINGNPLYFHLEILGSAIQAEPDEAVEAAWPAVEVTEANDGTKQLSKAGANN